MTNGFVNDRQTRLSTNFVGIDKWVCRIGWFKMDSPQKEKVHSRSTPWASLEAARGFRIPTPNQLPLLILGRVGAVGTSSERRSRVGAVGKR